MSRERPSMQLEIDPKTKELTIGEDFKQFIDLVVKFPELEDTVLVWLELKLPIGFNGVLYKQEDANDIAVLSETAPDQNRVDWVSQSVVSGNKIWTSPTVGIKVNAQTQVLVRISNVRCLADAGKSSIEVLAWLGTDPEVKLSAALEVEKVKPTEANNPILYFSAEPTNLIGPGEVTLRWDWVGDTELTLEVPAGITESKNDKVAKYRLAKTGTFTLNCGQERRQATVNVLGTGWHELRPFGEYAFPSVLFQPDSESDEALYAIFIQSTDSKAILCKSSDGVTGWEVVNTTVPKGMDSSPGVRIGQRLWLVGGSAADPDSKSRRVLFFNLLDPFGGWCDAKIPEQDWKPRAGHACAVFDEKILVFGGLNECGLATNELWTLSEEGKGQLPVTLKAERIEGASPPSPRCFHSAVIFNDGQLWIAGGVDAPIGSPLGDMWSLPLGSGVDWKKRAGTVVANSIGFGMAVCGKSLHAVTRTLSVETTATKAWTIGEKQITTTADTWGESETLQTLPQDWSSGPHSISMVGFKNRLYLRCLHRNSLRQQNVSLIKGAPLHVYVA